MHPGMGLSYQYCPKAEEKKSRRRMRSRLDETHRKRPRVVDDAAAGDKGDAFDGLPDDLVVSILCRLSSTATSPSDLVSVFRTCKRLNELATNPLVLAKVSARSLGIRACRWSESAHRFLKTCADSGNLEACYILGMIRFYCLGNRGSGASLMARAALGSHAAALYSLAVIQFNGSGGSKSDKDLRAGVALCARAAFFGHVDALRELGHCLQDGYGVRADATEGRRFLLQAAARDFLVLSRPEAEPAELPANRFLVEWFRSKWGESDSEGGLRLCSHSECGRPETRRHEFRRCSVCGTVNYCSRACQAIDWKLAHKAVCVPMDMWLLDGAGDNDGGGAGAGDGDNGGGGAGDGDGSGGLNPI